MDTYTHRVSESTLKLPTVMRGLALAIAALALASCGSSQQDMTARQIITALQKAGQPISGYVVYTAATDRNKRLGRPGQYVTKANFHDNRLPKDPTFDIVNGGAVETFSDEGDAKLWYDAASSLDKSLGSGWDYRDGKRVLRLSSDLTPAQAHRYQTVFEKLP